AIRKPSTGAMLSHAGKQLGSGWVFGLNEALDQTGATLGPLIVSLVLFRNGDYRQAFGLLLLSALPAIAVVLVARHFFPRPHDLEASDVHIPETQGFPRAFWLYMVANCCIAAGFADFALIAFHFQKTAVVSQTLIPVFYSVAMAMGAIWALIFGKLFDKIGLPVLLAAFLLSAFYPPIVFLCNGWVVLLGVVLWGIGLGAKGSLLHAIITGLVGPRQR